MESKIEIRKILVPVDGSEDSFRAARFALDIARLKNSKVTALYVIHVPAYLIGGAEPGAVFLPRLDEEKKIGQKYVERVRGMGKEAGVDVQTVVVDCCPSVVETITEYSKVNKIDLIVMGTKGRTGIKRFLLGSVADGVVTHAPCPVLVVR